MTDAVIWLDGTVVTVHCVEGMTAPMTLVLLVMLATSTVVLPAAEPETMATGKPAAVLASTAEPVVPQTTLVR